MKPIKRSYCLVEIEHSKDLPDLTDKVAGRIYTADGVEGATAILLDSKTAYRLAEAQRSRE
ncbi:hypothetical protein QTI05_22660 [Variovorax sp. J22R193]|uniref:hypothetical protein n=1 Tax=Variovorax fucosicus TaxID=3053517 RepID=UPI00257769E7|nr:hypothetical protein [Variovorax sp. J22R193]MDM0041860.1 hypothetical protein [Variovorax sp. J22R193]